jgi:hypothetical protein
MSCSSLYPNLIVIGVLLLILQFRLHAYYNNANLSRHNSAGMMQAELSKSDGRRQGVLRAEEVLHKMKRRLIAMDAVPGASSLLKLP